LNGRVITHQQRSPQCSAIELAPCPRRGARGGPAPRPRRSRHLLHGDFVDLADLVGPAEIVTVDRVINVYPGWERRAVLAAGRARRLFGLLDLRATRVVRLIIVAMNLMLRLQRKPVRAFFRSGDAIERIARENGLTAHLAHEVGPRGRSLSFAENEPSRVTKLPRGFRWKVSSRDDDQG
jgi:hypothetical protein